MTHRPRSQRISRILLIDDDDESYLITRGLLSRVTESGFELDRVSNSEAGLDALRRPQHDAYLLDDRLGARDGLELLREAPVDVCRGPFILLTGQSDHDLDMQAMQLGAADFLVKGEVTAALLDRSLCYSIEHQRNVSGNCGTNRNCIWWLSKFRPYSGRPTETFDSPLTST